MKLKNIINKFNPKNLVVDQKTLTRDFNVLRRCISKMFPSEKRLDLTKDEIYRAKLENAMLIANIGYDELNNRFYNDNYIQFHTRDNKWLIEHLMKLAQEELNEEKQLQQFLKELNQEVQENKFPYINKEYKDSNEIFPKLYKVKKSSVKKFIAIDTEFENARLNYEADIIRAQIKFMLTFIRPNGLLLSAGNQNPESIFAPKIYHPMISRFEKDVDKSFRQGVIDSLKLLGLDQHLIEVGLEKNANIWRENTMTDAFYNQHKLASLTTEQCIDRVFLHKCYSVRDNLKNVWLRQREYEYYQDHQTIINELDLATPNMKISFEEAQNLNDQVLSLEKRLQDLIRSHKSTENGDEIEQK
ncbi:MAG: hypothetical protein MJ060_00745 [Clostridia bacterium]|nr:hypothetical protein [Clostridia bacterium]